MNNPGETMAACFEQVASFFPGGNPKEQESFVRRADYLDSRNYERDVLADALERYHKLLGAGRETLEFIAELRRKETLAVITGQQAGIFTGPLYTLYKAITAIRLAQEQRKRLGRPVVPIFWIASEDHDWLEIAKTYFLNSQGTLFSCRLPGNGGGESVGPQAVPTWEMIAQQLHELPNGEFKRSVLNSCREFMEQADNLAQWFALTLQWLLRKWGLVFFEPMLPEFKRLAVPIYQEFLHKHEEIRSALERQTNSWTALGFSAQIQPLGGEANLFLADPRRRAILADAQTFFLRGQTKRQEKGQEKLWDFASLGNLIVEAPASFSPNVVARPVVQEFLLPTLVYVAGPGELNYWAQLGQVFSSLGFRMPIVYPRISAVILTPAWQKILKQTGLSLKDVYKGLQSYKEDYVRAQDTWDIDQRLDTLRTLIRQGYADLDPLEEIHPKVREWLVKNEEKVDFQVTYLKKKLWQAQRQRCRQTLKRFQMLEDGLTPLMSRQERVLNPLYFVVLFGEWFVEQVAGLPLTGEFKEQEILL